MMWSGTAKCCVQPGVCTVRLKGHVLLAGRSNAIKVLVELPVHDTGAMESGDPAHGGRSCQQRSWAL
jgi:hypothetical protein